MWCDVRKTICGGLLVSGIVMGVSAFPAVAMADSYYEQGKGVVAWNYSRSMYDNYQSQHLRFGYSSSGFQVMRYGSWKGNGVNSDAPTTNLYSQYSYGANWKKLW